MDDGAGPGSSMYSARPCDSGTCAIAPTVARLDVGAAGAGRQSGTATGRPATALLVRLDRRAAVRRCGMRRACPRSLAATAGTDVGACAAPARDRPLGPAARDGGLP